MEKRKHKREPFNGTIKVGSLIEPEALAALDAVYAARMADELNFGEGRCRDLWVNVPFWVMELIAMRNL